MYNITCSGKLDPDRGPDGRFPKAKKEEERPSAGSKRGHAVV
jgi:hypothetical protein